MHTHVALLQPITNAFYTQVALLALGSGRDGGRVIIDRIHGPTAAAISSNYWAPSPLIDEAECGAAGYSEWQPREPGARRPPPISTYIRSISTFRRSAPELTPCSPRALPRV